MLLKRKIFKLGNFCPTEDFQLTNRKFHFLPLDQITELSKRTMHQRLLGNKGHCTFPAGSQWILFNQWWDGKYSREFLCNVCYWGKSVIKKGWTLSAIWFKKTASTITHKRFPVSSLMTQCLYLSMKVKMSSMCWQQTSFPKNG